MIIMGCLGKFGALFVTIPDPVIGGLFMVVFGMSAKSATTNTNSGFVNKKKCFNLSSSIKLQSTVFGSTP